MRTAILSTIVCLALIAVAGAVSYAQGEDRGLADTAAELDAGPADLGPYRTPGVVVDAGVAAIAPPVAPSEAPHADPIADPSGAWAEFKAARKSGGLQLALGVLVAVVAAAVRRRLEPVPGAPSLDPKSWRARLSASLGAAAMLAWGVADYAAGATNGIGLATIAIGAVALVWRAIDPPRGEARAAK